MASYPSNGYNEVMSGTNNYTGSNFYGTSCPKTPIVPVANDDLCNKLYVDAASGGGIIGLLTDKGSLLTGDGTQAVIFDQNPYQTALTTTTVYDWNALALGQSRTFTTTFPTLIPLGAELTITYSGTDSIKGTVTSIVGTTITITITALASAAYVATTFYTSNPPAGVIAGSQAPPSFDFVTNPAVSTPNPPIIPANTMITDGISFVQINTIPTNFTVNLISDPALTTLGSSTPTPATSFPAPNNFQFADGAFVSTPTLFIIQIANLTQSVNFQYPVGGNFAPPDYCGQLNGYTLAYSTGSIVIDDDICLIADATSVTGLAWGVINTASIGAVTSVSGGANIVMSGTIPAPIVNLRNPLTAELNMGSQSLRDSASAVGTSGQVLSAGTGGQTLWSAVTATNTTITDTNTNATYYPTFVAGAGSQPLLADIATGAISLNPSNGNFNVVDTLKLTQGELAVGKGAGLTTQGANSVAIGFEAGNSGQLVSAVAVGRQAGQTTQGQNTVAVGNAAGGSSQGTNSVAVGASAGQTSQGTFSVAIGSAAGSNTQGTQAVAIGSGAGITTQQAAAVAVGINAGASNQGINTVAIGRECANTNQGASSVAIGNSAGQATQGASSVAIGVNAGTTNQEPSSVAIGASAGNNTQGGSSVAIGVNAGTTNQEPSSVAIGSGAGNNTQGGSSVAIGVLAGQRTQGVGSVAVGSNAGITNQGASCVAIGLNSGGTNQAGNSIAIGGNAGNSGQLGSAVSVGFRAGETQQQLYAVAIGLQAGNTTQGQDGIAIGRTAGLEEQGAGAVAIGFSAGQTTQGGNCVAIGRNAGQGTTTAQGANAIAIGGNAGVASQTAGSICLNASGVALNPNQVGLFINPIRGVALGLGVGVVFYDAATFELQYSTT
jgi:hypothetical protein